VVRAPSRDREGADPSSATSWSLQAFERLGSAPSRSRLGAGAADAVFKGLNHWAKLLLAVRRHARQGWTVHLHTNGHNSKSWLVAAACGLASRPCGASLLTLHSGMAPGYLHTAEIWRRWLARFACSLYTRVVSVSPEIQRALVSLGVSRDRTEILPAYLGSCESRASLSAELRAWLERHRPVLSTALFFRPEYGFDLLVDGLVRLRRRHPDLGCVVMGSGGQQAQAERRVREAGLENCILLAGDVDHDTCLALMSASDAFVRSTLEDGDSVSVREALAQGTPVVASATGMRPPGVILFQPGSVDDMLAKLELVISSPSVCEAPPADSGARLLELYRQLAAPVEAYAAA
jgi:glycogen(starch) synthase